MKFVFVVFSAMVNVLRNDPSYFLTKFCHWGHVAYITMVFDCHCHHNLENLEVMRSFLVIIT